MSNSGAMSDHLQEIWSNWRERDGPCKGCPHWGNGGGKAPFYGIGEITNGDPVVAFVGHEGGTGGGTELADIVSRDVPNLSEDQIDRIRKFIQESYPLQFGDYRARDLMESGICNGDLTDDGNPNSPHMRTCYDTFRQSGSRSYNLFFTNIKKCGESYGFDEEESGSREATSRCLQYLSPELEFLDPDIVIPFGNRAAGAVFSNYEFEQNYPSSFDKKHPYDAGGIRSESLKLYETGDGVGIIPSLHFSYKRFNQNFSQMQSERDDLPEGMLKPDYWKKMVMVADEFLDNSHHVN